MFQNPSVSNFSSLRFRYRTKVSDQIKELFQRTLSIDIHYITQYNTCSFHILLLHMYLRDIFKFKFQSTNCYEIKRLGKILIILKIYEMKGKNPSSYKDMDIIRKEWISC